MRHESRENEKKENICDGNSLHKVHSENITLMYWLFSK